MGRRQLAKQLGSPDTSAGIPEARWVRAMAFERLVRADQFVSQLLTTAIGRLSLDRPSGVRRADGHVSFDGTAEALVAAHEAALDEGHATIITNLALPFVGLETAAEATPVKPDFAIVALRPSVGEADPGTWLIMGDAKDYERVRSRIDDPRMLKGFLQVALGAESADAWTLRPDGMEVHRWGALAVPRNSFLQPEAVVECLDDHREEVRTRARERRDLLAAMGGETVPEPDVAQFVTDLEPRFDPSTCPSCSLFNHCRAELRHSDDPADLLVEIGVQPEHRATIDLSAPNHTGAPGVPASVVDNVRATLDGHPVWTAQRRTDPVGSPGTIEVALAKSDAAALGVHGLSIRRVKADRSGSKWADTTFDQPQSPTTRLAIMEILGQQLDRCGAADEDASAPVHLVVPDGATADLLVSIADSLAGVETSRLRWQRDLDQGRPALTFDGEPATLPAPLTRTARLAVSFLLEADRARAMVLRAPIVDLRAVLANHLVAGGPSSDAGRLDYLVEWAEATDPLDHRTVSDQITDLVHTPGARLSNQQSDQIHVALRGPETRRGRGQPDPKRYAELVQEELDYKRDVIERAGTVLGRLKASRLRAAHEALESDAQVVWRRRLHFHASDLVRFGRTSPFWRNQHVEMLDADAGCADRLLALGNPAAALDMALDTGTRDVARATVTCIDPLTISVESRRIGDGSRVVALHVDGEPIVKHPAVAMQVQKGSFKLSQMPIGDLEEQDGSGADGLLWTPEVVAEVKVGSVLVVADAEWFQTFKNEHQVAVSRPAADKVSAPKPDCDESSFMDEPEGHRYCCRPHEVAEADTSDWFAERRSRGEMNPETWPPIVDEDEFDVSAKEAPGSSDDDEAPSEPPAPDLTIDDID